MRPRGGDWLADEMGTLRRSGVDVLVSLLTRAEEEQFQLGAEGQGAEAAGIRYVSFPTEDRSVPNSLEKSLGLLHDLARELLGGRNVAVHCRQGIGRSSLIAAGVLIVSGVAVQQALAAVRKARGFDVPETAAQLEWVEKLPAEVAG
jgi:protein-tyrosine phosphatase